MSNNYVAWYAAQLICSVSVMEKLSMTGSTKITDDPMITGKKVLQQFLPTIQRSHLKKDSENFSQNYRWSKDHFSVFLLNSTNDPTITFQNFFFAERYRWSEDHNPVFLRNTTDDLTITNRFYLWSDDHYRRSDDHHLPTIRQSS